MEYYNKEQNIFERMDGFKFSSRLKVKKENLFPYTWGTVSLDHKITPLQRDHLVFLVGETGGGKTAFSFDVAIKNAKAGHRVVYISLEMSEESIIKRIARAYAGINIYEERAKEYPSYKLDKYNAMLEAVKTIENLKVVGIPRQIDFTIKELTELIEGYSNRDLIFVDNFGYISPKKGQKEYDRDVEVSKTLSMLVKDIQVPLIVLHHFRKSIKEAKKIKDIDSIMGSSKITHYADTVLQVIRNRSDEASSEEK